VERQAQLRKDGRLPFLRPDAKSQVTVEYEGNKPVRVDTLVLSPLCFPENPYHRLVKDYKLVRESCR